jgi:dolichol kinase
MGGCYFGLSSERALILALIGGLTSVVAELLPTPIDDNFTIPVMSSIILAALALVLPLFQ